MKTFKNKVKKTCTKEDWKNLEVSLAPIAAAQFVITKDIMDTVIDKNNLLDDISEDMSDSWDKD